LLPALGSNAYGRTPLALNLEVVTGEKPPAPARSSASEAMLVLNAMSEPRRELLATSLQRLATVVDRRKNPLFVSLDDSEERATVEELIAQTSPAFTAAANLAPGSWRSPEGDMLVRPAARCAPKRQCIRLGDAPGGAENEKRARFLAWPLGYAIVLAVVEPAELHKVAEALRTPGSFQIGLVLSSAELHSLRESPAQLALQRHARRLVKAMPKARTPLSERLANLASAGTGKDSLAWLRLPPETVLVVPRLGALATPEQLVADVRSRLATVESKVDWLASPR
jgi:hypothetical protein